MANAFCLPVIVFMCITCSLSYSDAQSPFIVAHKRVSHRRLNSNLELVSVAIDIYNRGSETAYDVTLTDEHWASEVFYNIIGNTSVSWEKLEPGSVVSHSFELESNVQAVYYGAPALITYRIPTKSKLQEACSTSIRPLNLLSESPASEKLDMVKRLLARYGSHVSAVLLVVLFANIISAPSKSTSAYKKRH